MRPCVQCLARRDAPLWWLRLPSPQGSGGVGGSHVAGALEQGQCPGTEAAGVPRRGAGPGWDVPARKASPGERGKPWPRGAGGQGARAYLSPEPCLTWQAAHGHEIKA